MVNKYFLKIVIKVKLHVINFIKISRVEIIKLGLVKLNIELEVWGE